MELLDGILSRRSVRSFTGEPLSSQQLETVVKAGMHAPSAHNQRPWHILTVEDKGIHLTIREASQYWKMLDKAAALVVMCADPMANTSNMPWEFIVDDCAAAMQNMLLAAHSLGLGAVWLGLCEEREREASLVKDLLHIPAGIHIMGMAAVGIPARSTLSAANRFEPEKWHKEGWQ